MKIFIAGATSRKAEFVTYSAELHTLGHIMSSSWLLTDREEMPVPVAQEEHELVAKYAAEDFIDIVTSDVVLLFSGERSPELDTQLGVALGRGRRVILVGPRTNAYHSLPTVQHCHGWDDAKLVVGIIDDTKTRRPALV